MAINAIESPKLCITRNQLVNNILNYLKLPRNWRKRWKITKIHWKWQKIAESQPKPAIQTLKIYANWNPLVDATLSPILKSRSAVLASLKVADRDFLMVFSNIIRSLKKLENGRFCTTKFGPWIRSLIFCFEPIMFARPRGAF